MVRIKIYTSGRKNNHTYKIVAASEKSPRDGKYICQIGYYDPRINHIEVNKELLMSFVKNGAQLTKSACDLLQKNNMGGF